MAINVVLHEESQGILDTCEAYEMFVPLTPVFSTEAVQKLPHFMIDLMHKVDALPKATTIDLAHPKNHLANIISSHAQAARHFFLPGEFFRHAFVFRGTAGTPPFYECGRAGIVFSWRKGKTDVSITKVLGHTWNLEDFQGLSLLVFLGDDDQLRKSTQAIGRAAVPRMPLPPAEVPKSGPGGPPSLPPGPPRPPPGLPSSGHLPPVPPAPPAPPQGAGALPPGAQPIVINIGAGSPPPVPPAAPTIPQVLPAQEPYFPQVIPQVYPQQISQPIPQNAFDYMPQPNLSGFQPTAMHPGPPPGGYASPDRPVGNLQEPKMSPRERSRHFQDRDAQVARPRERSRDFDTEHL